MSRGFKIFLLAFILSMPFWLFVDSLQANLENFFFSQEMNQNQVYLAQVATVNEKHKERDFKPEKVKGSESFSLNAESAISVWIDSDNEKILFEKNKDERLPIASVSKLMTALVVYDLDETYRFARPIRITKEAVDQNGRSPYKELKPGEKLSPKDLLKMALIESSNDAAFALADFIGKEGFVELMNFYAKKIELTQTKFYNPTGLEKGEATNYSSASDLVKLSEYILKKHPQIFEITSHNRVDVLNSDGTLRHSISQNTNHLLEEVPEIIGGKTGYTEKAKGCLLIVMEAPDNKGYVVNVILGSQDRFEEMKGLTEWVEKNYNWK